MKPEKISTKVELYICNHSREDHVDCASKGSKDMTDDLKKWTKEKHKGEIKVVRSGCLGKCSEGIAMASYPEKKFILEVRPEDKEDIKKSLEEALRRLKG